MRAMTNYGTVTAVQPRREQRTDVTTTSSSSTSTSSGCCQFRLVLYVMIFLAGAISYALRVSLSQALVAMVNRTSHHTSYNASSNTDELCRRDVNATSDDVIGGGKFDWDRNAQGAVLAAFYYGYALIQVNHKNIPIIKTIEKFNSFGYVVCEIFNILC